MNQLTAAEAISLAPRTDPGRLYERFLASCDVKESSRHTYRRALRQFMVWVEREGAQSPTRETVLDYKKHLQDRDLSSLTVSSYLVAVRKFFEWAEGEKIYPNVARGVKGARSPRNIRKDPLTIDQVKELLMSIDRSSLLGKRDFALLNLLVRTGLRTVEIVGADVGDIRQQGGEALLYIQGKGRDDKDDFVLLTHETLMPIMEYLKERGVSDDTAPLFASVSDRNGGERLTTRSVSRLVKEYLRGIGLDSGRLTAHSLRHTAITLCLKGGATVQEAKALGRHSNINTTMIYAHNIDRIAQAPERKIDALLAGVCL